MKSFISILWVLLALSATGAPPNVVLIISDDHHWGDYGFMDHPHLKTPRLDRLSREGLTFRHGYVPSSLCCPSLASIITGRYPHEHLITGNDPPVPKGMTPAEFQKSTAFRDGRAVMTRNLAAWPTLPGLLAKAGYVSLQTGKWWLGDYRSGGFTEGMTRGGRHGDAGLEIGRKTMEPIYEFIRRARTDRKPFLVWYAPMMPHDPHTPPVRLLEKYAGTAPTLQVAKYWAMVEWLDETCGALLDFLDRESIADNALVVFLADNGWITDPATGRYASKSKQSPYDGGLRTPIMVRWKGVLAAKIIDAPVSSLDLFPTVLKACNLELPAGIPGINLADETAVAARKTLYGECFTHNFVDLEQAAPNLRWRWILEDGWKLIIPAPQNEQGAPELYHMRSDPNEENNLAGAESSKTRVAGLGAKLDAWWPGRPLPKN